MTNQETEVKVIMVNRRTKIIYKLPMCRENGRGEGYGKDHEPLESKTEEEARRPEVQTFHHYFVLLDFT